MIYSNSPAELLTCVQECMVPFGGLSEGGVQLEDTVVVAPATGRFGGSRVTTVLAMGAKVVACGRSDAKLKKMK